MRKKTRKNFELDNEKDADIIAFMEDTNLSDVAMFRAAMRLLISSGVFKPLETPEQAKSTEPAAPVTKTDGKKEKPSEANNLLLNFHAPSDKDFN